MFSGVLDKVRQKIKSHPLPTILLALFLILTVLGISGSSMSAFDKMVIDQTPGIVLGQPRLVRSDEWGWQTQQTIAQKLDGYPAVNKKIGLGEDTSMILDVPFRSFYTLFKPQNLFFFIMPFANAFAAKWWFMALALVLGFYFLFDNLFPGKRLIVSLGALLLLFNPFTMWWYQSITLLTIAYALWACVFVVKIFGEKIDSKRLMLYGLGLSYSVLCFIFLLYPPFQLPTVYVVTATMAGFFYFRYVMSHISMRADRTRWVATIAAGFLVLVVFGMFYVTHKEIIHAINNTVYPGVRNIQSGESGVVPDGANFNILTVLSAPILVNLQRDAQAAKFYTNQSEAARIIAINLVFLPLVLYQILQKRRKERKLVDAMFLSTIVLASIFMLRLFTPLFNLPFKLLLFNKVQNGRLAIGLVFLCAVQLVLLGVFVTQKTSLSLRKALLVSLIVFAFFFDGSRIMAHRYPGFISDLAVLVVCLVTALCVFLMLRKRTFTAGLILFVLLSVSSSIFINPLYARSQPQSLEVISNNINSRYPDQKSWIVLGSVTFDNVPLAAGKPSYSGSEVYPQYKLWQSLDPSLKEVNAYNRFSHVVFTTDKLPHNNTFFSPQPDVLNVKFDCSVAKKLPDLGHLLSSAPLDTKQFNCTHQDGSLQFPGVVLYFYTYHP